MGVERQLRDMANHESHDEEPVEPKLNLAADFRIFGVVPFRLRETKVPEAALNVLKIL